MIKKLPISVVILTYNEEIHIRRCIENILPIVEKVFVVDSYSTDKTIEIAQSLGAEVYQNTWENNHAKQFNWGLVNCPITTEWVLRLDADEYLEDDMKEDLCHILDKLPKDTKGIIMNRYVKFLNASIKHGSLRSYVPLLRLWRTGSARIESRWMDEHVELLEGSAIQAKGHFVDHNLNGLTWWTEKHNKYANREVVDIMMNNFNFQAQNNDVIGDRNRKKGLYLKLPLFFRAFIYFCVRYFLLLGFLDGRSGLVWCFLQGFWYRFLVDAKLYQLKLSIGEKPTQEELKEYCKKEYNLEI